MAKKKKHHEIPTHSLCKSDNGNRRKFTYADFKSRLREKIHLKQREYAESRLKKLRINLNFDFVLLSSH